MLEKVFRAFYPNRYSDIKVDDQRKAILEEKKRQRLLYLEREKRKVAEQISSIEKEIKELEDATNDQ